MRVETMSGPKQAIVTALGLDRTETEIPIPGERRSEYRRMVDLAAVLEDGGHAHDCRVIDITNFGAQLTVPDTEKAPDRFVLYIGEINARLDCRVRWRSEDRVGVTFSAV